MSRGTLRLQHKFKIIMRKKNIRLIKYLTKTFEEIGNKEHEEQFLEAMETLSKMNFTIKRMSFGELMDQATWLAINSEDCARDVRDFDDDSILYDTCWYNLLYWQTDLDLFYEEVCSANPELEWIDEYLGAYLHERMCSIYPYLADNKSFNRYYRKHENELPYLGDSTRMRLALRLDNDVVVQVLTEAYEERRKGLQTLVPEGFQRLDECFHEITEIVYDAELEVPEVRFTDVLQGAFQNICSSCDNKEELKAKSFSMGDLYNQCLQDVLETIADSEYFSENVGTNYPEFGWVDDIVMDCLHQKLCSIYPYLKDEDAFVNYVESLKNEDHE